MDAAMEMAKRNGCMFFEVIGTNKYVTKICTRREFTLVKSIKYEGNDDSVIMGHNLWLISIHSMQCLQSAITLMAIEGT